VSLTGIVRELQRRNVLRAAILYATGVWALAQGIASLGPALGAPDWTTRWFLVAALIGFPLWIVFAWLYELTPDGIRRESEVDADKSILRATGRRLDILIIAVLAVAVVLLLTDRFVLHNSASSPAPVIADKSIAVLPLVNESGDAGARYFSDGLSESFIQALSQFPGLKVIGRASSFRFRNSKDSPSIIGEKLSVAHLLEGSVQRQSDAVRISAELINTRDGTTLWSAHYDRPYKDLFQLQDDITNTIAAELKTKLLGNGSAAAPQSDRPPSGNLDAYDAYLEGNFHHRNGSEAEEVKAIAYLRKAVEIDPGYAQAWARLSTTLYVYAGNFLGGEQARQAYAEQRSAAERALALAPNLAAAHLALGAVYQNQFDWAGAEREFRRALELAPNDPQAGADLAGVMVITGRLDESSAQYRRALAADPMHGSWQIALAANLIGSGDLGGAERFLKRTIALTPDAPSAHELLATVEIQRGNAKAALDEARKEAPGSWREFGIAFALQAGGNWKAADVALKDAIAKYSDAGPYQVAQMYALRSDADGMFHWLDRARAVRDPGITGLLSDPWVLRYRRDPRFAKLCAELKLPVPKN
jgi:TolB-like protein/Tfp pilus assembly protein PilF